MRKVSLGIWSSAAGFVVVFLTTTGTVKKTNAELIAYEDFGYNAGAPLNGLSGGTGFSDAWFVDAYVYGVTNGSLADPTGRLPTSGNSLLHTGLQPRARRNLGQLLGTPGTTIYCSFLLRQDVLGDFTQADHDWGGIILGGVNYPDMFGIEGLFIGRGARGSQSDKYVLGPAGNGAEALNANSNVPVVIGETALLAVRVDFLDGPDRATLYVNPISGSPEPDSGAVLNVVDLGMFSQLAITQGNNTVWTIDEIRIATTWQEVVIPEPHTSTLLGIAAIFGCGMKKRHS